jgi:hypothetical protein
MTEADGRPGLSVRADQRAASGRLGLTPRQLRNLRGASFGALVMLIVQFAIGMVVNLYATIPASQRSNSFLGAVGWALSKGPASLASHAGLAILIVLAAVVLVIRASIARHVPTIVLSSIGLLAIIAAAVNGARFVADGGADNASLAMGLATAVAMLCYALVVFVLGSAGTQPDPAS